MNKLFYIIFNSYYKHGEYKNDNPPLTVWGLFTVFLASICNDIGIVILYIEDPYRLSSPKRNELIFLLSFVLYSIIVYFLFFYNKKHLKIYETYKEVGFLNTKKAKYLGFFIVFFVIISPIIIALIRNKIFFNYWV